MIIIKIIIIINNCKELCENNEIIIMRISMFSFLVDCVVPLIKCHVGVNLVVGKRAFIRGSTIGNERDEAVASNSGYEEERKE